MLQARCSGHLYLDEKSIINVSLPYKSKKESSSNGFMFHLIIPAKTSWMLQALGDIIVTQSREEFYLHVSCNSFLHISAVPS